MTIPAGFDKVSAALAFVASVVVAWFVWFLVGPPLAAEPPALGTRPPTLRLIDPATAEPLVLLGLRGKVVWLTFWSADGPTGESDLADLEAVWTRLKSRPGFAMAALSIDAGRSGRLREAVLSAGATLPVYLATPETRRAFGAGASHLPLHVLIQADGRIGAVVQGHGADTLARLAAQVERRLDEIGPPDRGRFSASLDIRLNDRRRGHPWRA